MIELNSTELPSLRRDSERERTGLSLGELVRELERVSARLVGDGAVVARGLHQDSRQVVRGDVFAARPGSSADGLRFVADAEQRGAVAVLVERGSELPGVSLPLIEVNDVRLGLALAAEALYGHPSRAIDVVGITGTNGKTTSSWLAAAALDGAGARAGRLGTLGFAFGPRRFDGSLTTPEADAISRYAAEVRDHDGTALVMEVSSHALVQARVDALRFEVAAFSNLTQDHLDYHQTMDSYGAAKARLFTELSPAVSVINIDDPFGKLLAERCSGRILTVSQHDGADVRSLHKELGPRGMSATVQLPSGVVELESRLVGAHNLDNLLMALAIVEALGLDADRAARALRRVGAIPGRFERCDVPADDVIVIVDYAHTPDALERALSAARKLTTGKLFCVFGCGGDRDPTKREKMGDVVGQSADRAVVTSDNPRSESPEAIAAAIELGLARHGGAYTIELDRARAIDLAVREAGPDDVVLVAGKGHEPYQILGDHVARFDDRVEARRALALRREQRGR